MVSERLGSAQNVLARLAVKGAKVERIGNASRIWKRRTPGVTLRPVAGAFVALLFVGIAVSACSATPKPKPSAPAGTAQPADPTQASLAALTEYLKLDRVQQERTRLLFQELAERNKKIQEAWNRGERVRWEVLLGSQAIFERDFLSILTEDQKHSYADLKLKLMGGGRVRGVPPGRG